MTLGLLELLSLKLNVAVVFLAKCHINQLFVTHLPASWSPVGNLNKLNRKDEGCSSRNFWWRSHVAITVLALDHEVCLLAELHGHDTSVPSFDDLALANSNLEGFSMVSASVEDGAILESTLIVNGDFLTLSGSFALTFINHLLDNASISCDVYFALVRRH